MAERLCTHPKQLRPRPFESGQARLHYYSDVPNEVTERDLVYRAYRDAQNRLARYLGEADTYEVFDQALFLARLPGRIPVTPNELLRVAVMLMETFPESAVSATGSGLKVSALLLGADELS